MKLSNKHRWYADMLDKHWDICLYDEYHIGVYHIEDATYYTIKHNVHPMGIPEKVKCTRCEGTGSTSYEDIDWGRTVEECCICKGTGNKYD